MQNNPGYLRKLLWCLGSVILIQLLKKVFDKSFPDALLFHHFLLTLIQVAILLWTIIILVLPGAGLLKKAGILLLILALPEMVFTYLLNHPAKIPASLRSSFRYYYTDVETNIIQYNRATSVYDSALFYTLKPSSRFLFRNTEFADSFFTNRLGLRDDDSSLAGPQIICLGDSYAMGWGVEQNEAFPEQLAARTKKKLLNAAISSFGTAREMKMLSKLDTSNLQYLVIQYCRNDYAENREYVRNNYQLAVSSKAKYDSLRNEHAWSKRWFPGKRAISISKIYAEFNWPAKKRRPDSSLFRIQEGAQYFADILLHSPIDFKKVKVLVVDLSEREKMNNDFLSRVNLLLSQPVYREHFNNNLVMVPVSDLIREEDYYILDPHLKASGHRKVAERLASLILN